MNAAAIDAEFVCCIPGETAAFAGNGGQEARVSPRAAALNAIRPCQSRIMSVAHKVKQ